MSWSLNKIVKFQPAAISLVFTIIGLITYFIGIPFMDIVELRTIDLRFNTRGVLPAGNEIVLAVIDEKSVDKEGKWIWPRSKIARLVDKLSDAGAKVIAFDIGFLEPDEQRVVQTIEHISEHLKPLSPSNREFLRKIKEQSDNDLILAQAIKQSKSKVVLGHFSRWTTSTPKTMRTPELPPTRRGYAAPSSTLSALQPRRPRRRYLSRRRPPTQTFP